MGKVSGVSLGGSGSQEMVPYSSFVEHFSKIKEWQATFKNFNSPFMKLMQIEDLFFCKVIKKRAPKPLSICSIADTNDLSSGPPSQIFQLNPNA